MPATMKHNATASEAYSSGVVTAAPIAAAVISEVVDSGPTLRVREEPTSVYASSPPASAHSPTTALRPATSAYAMTCGIAYAATVTPATTSPRSQPRS